MNEGRVSGYQEILEMLDRIEMEPHLPPEPPGAEGLEAGPPMEGEGMEPEMGGDLGAEGGSELTPEQIEMLKAKLAELTGE